MLSGATFFLHASLSRCCNSLMIKQNYCWLPVGQHCWQHFRLPNRSCMFLLYRHICLVWVSTIPCHDTQTVQGMSATYCYNTIYTTWPDQTSLRREYYPKQAACLSVKLLVITGCHQVLALTAASLWALYTGHGAQECPQQLACRNTNMLRWCCSKQRKGYVTERMESGMLSQIVQSLA